MKLYFATLVGLLRAKAPLITELKEAAYGTVRSLGDAARRRRVEEQEDLLFRVKEV